MRKLRWLVVLALLGGGGYWWLKPETPASTVSVTERAKQTALRDPNALSAKIIPDEDLPPQGTRSLFDHLVAQNDGLPYPFEKVIELIQKQDPNAAVPLSLMIPDGRSLLKASADFHAPRVLVAADFQAAPSEANFGLAPRGQLFLGFVENAKEIEVISYNEAAGRFEFQLVQDYSADGQRRIVYAQRQICLTCHQGSAPIFPQRPWNETNGQPETATAIQTARGAAPYLNLPIANPLGVPERFDELTDVGNFIPVTQRAWIDGCGQNADCRKAMLKLALGYLWNPAGFSTESPESWKLREQQAKQWPAGGIAVPESDIRNRDPLGQKKGLRGTLRDWFAEKAEAGAGAKDNEDLDAFDRLPKLPQDQDPLTPRAPKRLLSAQDVDGAFGLAALFSDSDFKLLEQAAAYKLENLLAAVDRAEAGLFTPAPFARIKTLSALFTALGAPARGYAFLDVSEMSPPVGSAVPKVAISAGSVLEHYEQYCFACHRGNPAKRLDFMSGGTEAEVLETIKNKSEIRDALDWARYQGTDKASKLMPPADSPQHARMAEALKANPKLLEEMSAAVPGLFDF